MFIQKIFIALLLISWIGLTPSVLAQSSVATGASRTLAANKPEAVVSARDSVAIGKNLIFSAARSYNPIIEQPVIYSWDFGDGRTDLGEEVVHAYAKPGEYQVTLKMLVGNESDSLEFPVFVYQDLSLIVSDNPAQEEQITALVTSAREQGEALVVARAFGSIGAFTSEGVLGSALLSNLEALQETKKIILWTHGSSGLSGLTSFFQEQKKVMDFAGKQIIVVTEDSLPALEQLARSVFAILSPREIWITRTDALREVILGSATPDSLAAKAIPYRLVDSGFEEFRFTNFLSFFVSYLIAQGIPASAILLVLLLPVIATIVAFFKQVIGLTTFGVYLPSVIALSFLTIGLKLGLVVLLVVVLTSVATRKTLRHYRLSYTPRMAFVLIAVSLAILAAITLLTWLAPVEYAIADLITASIFPMLIMSTLAEKFVSVQTEKGIYSAVRLTLEVTGVAAICYFIARLEWLRTALLAHAELLLVFLAANLALGRFTGLRLVEYFRFQAVIKKIEEEE